uniref:RUS family member 1 n=2 Tax=Cyprinus carpio TaxID=7962 RepID=A0A8C1H6U3_CYPCA
MAEMEDGEGVVATERYGSQESWRYFLKDGRMKRQRDAVGGRLARNSVSGVFQSVFLPQGYPESVSEDYLQYQLWDTVQAFSSSLSGTLATQASLRGVGVGNQEATVAAATITWLLRGIWNWDAGKILFAWLKGLFADILNDVAMFMEIAAPHFPPFFTLIVCIAGIFKSIVGVAGGATRAALTVHQARRNNMADISAKDGSQETLVNLAGLLVSLALIPLVTDNPLLTFILFFLFTVLHLFANYKAVRSVVMETLNEARLSIVLHRYLLDGQLLSPAEANQKEPVFLSLRRTVPIKLGVRLGDIVQEPGELQLALKNNSKPYLIGIKNGTLCVCLGSDASVRDEIMAACQALCLRAVLHDDSSLSGALKQLSNTKDPWELVSQSHKMVNQIFQTFLKELDQAKWHTDQTLLDWNEWRVEWSKKRS